MSDSFPGPRDKPENQLFFCITSLCFTYFALQHISQVLYLSLNDPSSVQIMLPKQWKGFSSVKHCHIIHHVLYMEDRRLLSLSYSSYNAVLCLPSLSVALLLIFILKLTGWFITSQAIFFSWNLFETDSIAFLNKKIPCVCVYKWSMSQNGWSDFEVDAILFTDCSAVNGCYCLCRWITDCTYLAQFQGPKGSTNPFTCKITEKRNKKQLQKMHSILKERQNDDRNTKQKMFSKRCRTTTMSCKLTTKWHKMSRSRWRWCKTSTNKDSKDMQNYYKGVHNQNTQNCERHKTTTNNMAAWFAIVLHLSVN